MSRTFVIGDIHGMIDPFNELLERIGLTTSDTLILLGDYVDRGPHSRLVVERVLDLIKTGHHVIALKGNHEEMLLQAVERGSPEDRLLWLGNGGRQTLKSYPDGRIPGEHLAFFRSLRLWHEMDGYFFVHAGVEPELPPSAASPEAMLWIRREFVFSTFDWGKKIVFGHTPFREPFVGSNKIGIDTGCVYGGSLTSLELPGETWISVH